MLNLSLKMRLALGAVLLGLGTILASAIIWLAMDQVSERLEKALASEMRRDSFSTLSNQAASYLVIATETVQTNVPTATRLERLAPVEEQLKQSFLRLHEGLARAVSDAQALGLDEQSRFGTQSLGLARMEALLNSTSRALAQDVTDARTLKPHLDIFSGGFDPLLSQAVANELLFRNSVLLSIETLRERLRLTAIGIACATLLALGLYYFALIRPQFLRLDRVRSAAQKIGAEDFEINLPDQQTDEIGQLYAETNKMAAALSARHASVKQEWGRLNETIAERTEKLQKANAALAEIDENRRRFFADVSHELRTPLTVILMEAQIGAKGADDPQESFAVIEARANRLYRRIEDLLRVARSDSGQLQLELSNVDVPQLLQQVEAEIGAEVVSAGMSLTILQPPDATVFVDPNWTRQVVVGLVRNAVRHARSGEQIAVSADIMGSDLWISVIDNGDGIPSDEHDVIFDRFAQGSGSKSSLGFGLGLALARWVVEEHGGSIEIESPVNRSDALGSGPGTKISVRFPMNST